jgi:hypothetical protein
MTLMFLPVLSGGLVIVVLRAIMKQRLYNHRLYRLFTFLYHSSMAVYVNGMLVKGILEIAGASVKNIAIFEWLSAVLAMLSIWILFLIIKNKMQKKSF